LQVVPIALPPLRDREDDVLAIARHFLRAYAAEEGKRFKTFAHAAEAALAAYDWPGNVRQLQNVIRHAVVLHDGETVDHAMLPSPLGGERPAAVPLPAASPPKAEKPPVKPLWQVEREAIEAAIRLCGGNIPRAALLLEVSPSTLYRKRLGWRSA
ncbi:MAG: helix-turn-helix domain-containing protein, partial [Alphaproteobacteria bacterium]